MHLFYKTAPVSSLGNLKQRDLLFSLILFQQALLARALLIPN